MGMGDPQAVFGVGEKVEVRKNCHDEQDGRGGRESSDNLAFEGQRAPGLKVFESRRTGPQEGGRFIVRGAR